MGKRLLALACAFLGLTGTVFAATPRDLWEAWGAYGPYSEGVEMRILQISHPDAFAYGEAPQGPSVNITIGMIAKVSVNELRFIIAHELAHVLLKHQTRFNERVNRSIRSPFTVSSIHFLTYGIKWDEDEADMVGKRLYLQAGYDPSFFRTRYEDYLNELNTQSSLTPFDPHFSMKDRFFRLSIQ